MLDTALNITDLTRRERGVKDSLLDRVTFSVRTGTLCALVGADGAGKTTLLRCIAGLLKPQEGAVEILGTPLYSPKRKVNAELLSCVSYMPQMFGLYTDLSVMENLDLYADLYGLKGAPRKERIAELLKLTDLDRFTQREAGSLSGGMKQKLGLACALLNQPRLLLLDEPTVGVDPLSRRELFAILSSYVSEGTTVLLATTYMDEAERCDSVVMMEGGKVLLTGTPDRIAQSAQGRTYLASTPEHVSMRDLQADFYNTGSLILDAVPEARGVKVVTQNDIEAQRLIEEFPQIHFQAIEPDLEAGYLVNRSLLLRETPRPVTTREKKISGGGDSNQPPIIRANNLVRRFGNFTAVNRTTFSVGKGEIFGLLGPNGAGKTTTFKMLCGLLSITEGDLTIAGLNASESRTETRQKLGYMSQKFALYGDLTVRENLSFFAAAYGLKGDAIDQRILELLKNFDLQMYENFPSKQLPGGVKQRLAMAAALIHKPEILFLDEPTSGADVTARRQFWQRISDLSAEGTTVIVTTHFMQEALYCDRLMIQDAGTCLFLGTPEELCRDFPNVDEAFIGIVHAAREKEGRYAK